ncbi:MAG: protein-glutamate O-methyltransferase CheR [Thermodesulfovibrionales bacterium]|nr:protein-glutamate O-methyltransferase CheR [Thermodesulfovibrionales bacterium]
MKSFKAQGGQSPPCEIPLSDEIFGLFQNLIYKTAGIRLSSQKKGLLSSRLLRRLKKLGIDSLHEYYRMVEDDSDELVEMLNCISTNTTHFFRENHHFEYLKNKTMPELLRIKSSEKTIRIWSAGCSTGEEPYSIAITLCEALGDMRGWDIKVLATDISTKVLDAAWSGIYEYEAVSDMPEDIVRRYFLRGTGENIGKVKVRDFLKDMIRFRRLNLKEGAYPFKRKFDVIFCRNVMIYFDEGMKQHVLSMFHRHLSDSGYLFLGHSETMLGSNGFKPVFITVYKKI